MGCGPVLQAVSPTDCKAQTPSLHPTWASTELPSPSMEISVGRKGLEPGFCHIAVLYLKVEGPSNCAI